MYPWFACSFFLSSSLVQRTSTRPWDMLCQRHRSNSVAIAVHETARLGFVRNGPAEINFHFDDLAVTHSDDFGVTKFFTVRFATFVGHEDSVAIRNEILKFEIIDPLAVWPAPRKICRAINPVIERTGEVKILADQFLDRPAIFRYIGVVRRAHDGDDIFGFDERFHFLTSVAVEFLAHPEFSARPPRSILRMA